MDYTDQINNLRELLIEDHGEPLTEQIMAGYAERRPVTLRFNPLKISGGDGRSALSEAGIAFLDVPWYPDAVILHGAREEDLQRLPIYEHGAVYLQSLSSMLPPLYLEPKDRDSVLDMAAAPGGKTAQICALSGGKAFITACERDKIRFQRLKFNLERQGVPRVTVMCVDACTLDEFFSFDKILLDAPCSGSGTVQHDKPFRIDRNYVEKCASLQEKLLKKAIRLLKKGGTLIYSTCSVFRRENEVVLERALKGSGAQLAPIEPFPDIPTLPSPAGTVCVCPNELFEGFFVAKITK